MRGEVGVEVLWLAQLGTTGGNIPAPQPIVPRDIGGEGGVLAQEGLRPVVVILVVLGGDGGKAIETERVRGPPGADRDRCRWSHA